jgi:hypothetical protein
MSWRRALPGPLVTALLLAACGSGEAPPQPPPPPVQPPGTIAFSGLLSQVAVPAGQKLAVSFGIVRGGGFAGEVRVEAVAPPTGLVVAPVVVPAGDTSGTLVLEPDELFAPGAYTIALRGTAGTTITPANVALPVQVTAPLSFGVHLAIHRQSTGTSIQVVAQLLRGSYFGPVTLRISGLPGGVRATDGPQSWGDTASARLTVDDTVTARLAELTIQGIGVGSRSFEQKVPLFLLPPASDVVPVLLDSLVEVAQGETRFFTPLLASLVYGAQFGVSGLPQGLEIVRDRSEGLTTSTRAAADVAPGEYTATVRVEAPGYLPLTTRTRVRVLPGRRGTQFTRDYCEASRVPVWFGLREGSRPWRQVAPVGTRISFDLESDTVQFVWVTALPGGGFETESMRLRRSQVSEWEPPCHPPRTTVGSVTGVSAGEASWVSFGGSQQRLQTGVSSFVLPDVSPGPGAFIASRVALAGPVRAGNDLLGVVIRRGLNPPESGSLGQVDVAGAADVITPVEGLLLVANRELEAVTMQVDYVVPGARPVTLYRDVGRNTVLTPYRGIALNRQAPGEMHFVIAEEPATGRGVGIFAEAVGDGGMRLGERAQTATGNRVASSPFVRRRGLSGLTPFYSRVGRMTYESGTSTDRRLQSITTVTGFSDFAEFPDMALAPGWKDLWGPLPQYAATATIVSQGWSAPGGLLRSPVAHLHIIAWATARARLPD